MRQGYKDLYLSWLSGGIPEGGTVVDENNLQLGFSLLTYNPEENSVMGYLAKNSTTLSTTNMGKYYYNADGQSYAMRRSEDGGKTWYCAFGSCPN